MRDEKVMCAHCGAETDDGGRICVDCFVVGHRGETCGEYCKPDRAGEFALVLLKSRGRDILPRRPHERRD